MTAVYPESGALETAKQLIWTSKPAEAERLLLEIRSGSDDTLEVATLLAECRLVQGRMTPDHLEELEGLAIRAGGTLGARSLALAGRCWVQMGDNARASKAAQSALELDDSDPVAGANALISISGSLYDEALVDQAEEHTRRAATLVESDGSLEAGRTQAHIFHGLCLMWLDELDAAQRVWLTGEEIASRAGDTTSLPFYFFLRGYVWFLEGRLSDAEAEIETAMLVAHEIGTLAYDVYFAATLARIKLHHLSLGEAGELLGAVESGWEDTDHPGDAGVAVCSLRSEILETEQNYEGALDEALEGARIKGHHERALTRLNLGPDIVRLAMVTGRRDIAEEWASYVELSAEKLSTAFAQGAAKRARGWQRKDPELLEEALRLFRATPRRAIIARTEEDLGLMHVGDRAVLFCNDALATYGSMGAHRDVSRVLARLRELGVRSGVRGPRQRPTFGRESLTPTESRVAALMLDGLSYPAIGKRLFISHRTVETHATHIFQKLGIQSRRDLQEALR